ncbi:hypothetical protein I3842_11G182900 [Carya illinoinensis]|uniref:Uncharacterized protein n=1 Tax=Carya illinoinensis TaxID=32201 RepID=A0A922DSI7_CARIL|nr:hypothetical protein I3842_11G182900 [Carya illinoinensis]
MIPACFSQPSTLSSNTSHEMPQNLITCIFQTQLCSSPTHLTLIWSKILLSFPHHPRHRLFLHHRFSPPIKPRVRDPTQETVLH